MTSNIKKKSTPKIHYTYPDTIYQRAIKAAEKIFNTPKVKRPPKKK